jgi:lysyl-tRNA synthetase class 2
MDLELLEKRAEIIRSVRHFFDTQGYLEVDTPLLSPDLIPETCLEVFETSYKAPPESRTREDRPYWLIPSPEIWMKQLIAQHKKSMYQICKSFRNGESTGRLHSPEFTMLEYYTIAADYIDSLTLTEKLFAGLNAPCPMPFLRMTMEEAFCRYAGFNLYTAAENGGLKKEACTLGLDPRPGLSTAQLYDLIFIHAVEPKLPKDQCVALMDYPAFVPCLAKKNQNGRTMERWELYYRGVELANCYTEENDAEEVRRYFEAEAAAKEKTALVRHRVDAGYWNVFKEFPPCSGVALGLDRLIMVLTRRSTIDGVLPFPMEG